jgi:aspartyl-tRNA(Asn)/glutamyl-tRNA(Gln) amidotransferase subunit C
MTLSLKEVEHIARLARLALSDAEKTRYTAQLSSILEYAARLQSVDTSGVVFSEDTPPPQQPGEDLRPDDPQPGLSDAELFDNAPQVHDRQFRMPPVFD